VPPNVRRRGQGAHPRRGTFGDEILQRVFLEGEVAVGAEVVNPDGFGPRRFAGRLVIEEDDVGFDALLVKDAGGQAQKERAGDALPPAQLANGLADSQNVILVKFTGGRSAAMTGGAKRNLVGRVSGIGLMGIVRGNQPGNIGQ
jgi:hypothetical protein